MNADLKYFALTQQIIGVYYDVYNELGDRIFRVCVPKISCVGARTSRFEGL